MVKLNEISHTATFAWSNETLPTLATGSFAGVIDGDFSSASSLSFHSLYTREPLLSVDADAKFHDLDWSKNNALLAGALENGTVQFWNTEKLHSDKTVTAVATGSKHSGPIKTLQFNPTQHNVLASGGANGEIFIWDTAKIDSLAPFAPGSAMTPMDTVTSVAWNNSVAHIFAAAGSAGYTSIWDLRAKKEVLHLTYTSPSNARASLSTVAWHPEQSTKLVTASDADGAPVILTWDLRNSNVPEQTLEGHKKGVLSLDWNARDPTLLLSCGKDNTTLLWNPISGEKLAQYPTTANWCFKTRFAPQAPDVFATSSFDKKVTIQTMQDTSPPVNKRINSTTDNEFWNEISTTETQQPEYYVKQAPNWYGRPSTVSFAFGGKVVTVGKTGPKSSEIKITKAPLPGSAVNEDLVSALNSGDFKSIIDSRLESAYEGVNKSDWELLNKLDGTSSVFEKFISLDITDDEKPESKDTSGEEFFKDLNDHPKYDPTGAFKFSEKDQELTKALLTKKLSKAVDLSLKEDKLVEALIIALNGPQELKEKVTNYYFNKYGAEDSTARLLYSVSSGDMTDLVENGDVTSWKEIGTAIQTYASSPEVSKQQFTKLGDRVLAAEPVKNRDDAIVNYINASSLDKVAEIWNSELKALEAKIMESKNTSAYDAHFASLSEFVEKFSAYRSVLKMDGVVSETSSSLTTILEYINIISTNGQFELASKFLSLLSDEVPAVKLEQERIAKATGVTKTAASAASASTRRAGAGRYGNLAQPMPAAVPAATPGYPAATPATRGRTLPSNPYMPAGGAAPAPAAVTPAVPSYGYQPPAAASQSPYAQKTPLYGQTAAAQNTPYNPYKPAAAAAPAPSAIPPPPKAKKHETEGWNDLPSTFHQQPSRRSTPAAAAVTPGNGSATPPLSRTTSFANAPTMPPPPRSVSKSRKTPTLGEAKPAPPPQINNRYGPASLQPKISALNNLPHPGNGFSGVPPPQHSTPSAPPKNPYAPSANAGPTPMGSAYAPPQAAAVAPPPMNAFAPPPQAGAPPVSNPYAPAQATPSFGVPTPSYGAPAPAPSAYAAPVPSAPPKVGPPPKGPSKGGPSSNGAPAPTAAAPATTEKYPAGDRSHIPADQQRIYQVLTAQFEKIKPVVPEKWSKQVVDTERRLNLLFDHLNNQDLLTGPTVASLTQLCDALEAKDCATAMAVHENILSNHAEETGQWAVGVKRLVHFCDALIEE